MKKDGKLGYSLTQLSESKIYMYGEVNGMAWKRKTLLNSPSYGVSIKFFDGMGKMYKITTNEQEGTIRTIAQIKYWIETNLEREVYSKRGVNENEKQTK